MRKYQPENQRVKHRYQIWLRNAGRRSEASIDKAMAAIERYEDYTGRQSFKTYHTAKAVGFKRHLAQVRNDRSGKPLSASTTHATLAAVKAFMIWLADQPGYRSKVTYADAEYFNSSSHDRSVANARRSKPVPTMDQIRHILASMPSTTEIDRRDRALIAFTILTGARAAAIASMKFKHVDIAAGRVSQDARDVHTKFSKTFESWFFPIGDDIRQIVEEWVRFLREERRFGEDDPVFPSTKVEQCDGGGFRAVSLDRKAWQTTTPIRQVFNSACQRARLPYFNPHSFRSTLVRIAEQMPLTPEAWKAWSQNLGHENEMTTYKGYGEVPGHRQAEILRTLGDRRTDQLDMRPEVVDALRTILSAVGP